MWAIFWWKLYVIYFSLRVLLTSSPPVVWYSALLSHPGVQLDFALAELLKVWNGWDPSAWYPHVCLYNIKMLHILGKTGAVWARLLIVIASPQWSPAFLEWLKLLIEKLTVKQVLLRTSVILQLELGMAKSHFMFRKPECFLTMGLRLWKEWTSGSVWNAPSVRESILMSGWCLRLQLPCGFRLATFGRQNDMEKGLLLSVKGDIF